MLANQVSRSGRTEAGAEALRRSRACVRAARICLADPTAANVARCGSLLEEAAGHLRDLQRLLAEVGRDAALADSALALRREVRQVGVLLDSAASFNWGWTRRISTMAAGYTARGTPPPLLSGPRLWMEG